MTPRAARAPQAAALAALGGQSLFLGFSSSVFYTAANTLFLLSCGSGLLPAAYLATAAAGLAVGAVLARLSRGWPVARYCTVVPAFFALLLLLSRFVLDLPGFRWMPFLLMTAFTLLLPFNAILPSAQAGQLFDLRRMKRLYPLVMAVQVLGVILGGAAVGPLASLLGGTANLLPVAGAGMVAALAFVRLAARRFPEELSRAPSAGTGASRNSPVSAAQLLRRPYPLLILAYLILVETGSNLVNFLFVAQIGARFAVQGDLTAFFGTFMAGTMLLTLVFLALLSGRLLARFGIGFGLTANPAAVGTVLCAAVLAGILPGALPAVFFLVLTARLLNFVVTTALKDPALKASYQPLAPDLRARLQTLAEGFGVPLGTGAAGALLLCFQAVPDAAAAAGPAAALGAVPDAAAAAVSIAAFTAALMAGNAVVGMALSRAYRNELASSIRRPGMIRRELVLADRSGLEAVQDLLRGGEAARVRWGLDLLEEAGHPSLEAELARLVEHPDAGVREDAYRRIERLKPASMRTVLASRVEREPSLPARAAALRAACALTDGDAEAAEPYLADGDPGMRLAAMTALLRYGGIPGAVLAGPGLEALRGSAGSADRLQLARLVGEVAERSFYKPLLPLLADPSADIRREALQAAGRVAHPALLPAVMRNLSDIPCRTAAMAALGGFREALPSFVGEELKRPSGSAGEGLLRLLRACGRAGGEAMIRALAPWTGHGDAAVRTEVLRALSLCGWRSGSREAPRIRECIGREIHGGARTLLALREIGEAAGTSVLASALRDGYRASSLRVILLLSFLHDRARILDAGQRLAEGDEKQRSLALELLDVTVGRGLKHPVLAFLGGSPEILRRRLGLEGMGAAERVRQILGDPEAWPDPWIRGCAAYAAAREPGLGIPLSEGDGKMLQDIEKVVVLKSIGIFEGTPDAALSSVASIVEPVESKAGEPIINKGDLESCMYLIVHGKVRVHDGTALIAELAEGEIIGEMALLDPAPRSASATAVEDTLLFRIGKDAFDAVLADNPEVMHGVIRVLCRRLRSRREKARDAAQASMA